MLRRLSLLFVMLFGLFPALASAQTGPGARFLKARHDAVLRIAHQRGDAAQRSARISAEIGELLDYASVSREALGATHATLSEAQRTEFTSLLRRLVERNYQGNIEHTGDYVITYGAEEATNGVVVLHTTARPRSNRRATSVAIDYHLRAEGRAFKVVDVITDGVSMVRNYRTQFGRIIQRDGFDALLTRMRTRLEQGGAGL